MDKSQLTSLIKNNILPKDFELSGNLTPAQAKIMIDTIKDSSEFLKKVQTVPMLKLETEVDAYDIAEGILIRVAEGDEPTAEQLATIKNIGCKLQALPVQLFANVTKSSIENNAFNTTFDQDVFKKFMRRFSNELVYLGFAGVGAEGTTFKELNNGWLDIIRTSEDTNKATYSEDATVSERLTALVENVHEDVIGEASIVINPKDYQKYLLEIAKDTATASILLNATAKSFLGYPIEVQNKIPSGTYIATPLKNLVFGMCQDIFRAREWNNRKRIVEYTFDVSCDYEVVVKKWATICEVDSTGNIL
jgi:hypothetical protein